VVATEAAGDTILSEFEASWSLEAVIAKKKSASSPSNNKLKHVFSSVLDSFSFKMGTPDKSRGELLGMIKEGSELLLGRRSTPPFARSSSEDSLLTAAVSTTSFSSEKPLSLSEKIGRKFGFIGTNVDDLSGSDDDIRSSEDNCNSTVIKETKSFSNLSVINTDSDSNLAQNVIRSEAAEVLADLCEFALPDGIQNDFKCKVFILGVELYKSEKKGQDNGALNDRLNLKYWKIFFLF
jgi:hypothetical protein